MRSRLIDWTCVVIVVVVVAFPTRVCGIKREYYVGAVEEEWDYAPGGDDLVSFRSSDGSSMKQTSISRNFLEPGPERIGRKYMKAMYREFTDATFTQRKPREQWMGLLGPTLAGEQGDIIVVYFKNMAPTAGRNFSMHPHGLQYTKENEGALYLDDTSGKDKMDESVAAGQQYRYEWEVTKDVTPTPDDPDCLTWTYHSHVNTVKDVNAGLLGILLTCRPGALATLSKKYAKQFAMVVNVFDENESWYIDHNMQTYLSLPQTTSVDGLKEDDEFKESNLMHGLNGLVYGHLRGLDVCVGTNTLWHLIGFGTEIDIHSLSISGHSFLVNRHRVDAVSLNPVDFVTAELEVQTMGQWRIQCSVLDHLQEGMVALLNASDCGYMNSSSSRMHIDKFQHHFIAVEEVEWNYGPSGNNLFDGGVLTQQNSFSDQYFHKGADRVGGVYRKALFREYEDVTFSAEKKRGAEEEHLGFLGPVLRVEVGTAVALTLRNNAADQAFSINPHGATYVKMWEGALYNDSTKGQDHFDDFVEPGQVRTTYWFIPDIMGPGPMDPPCITRVYTSSSLDMGRDAYSGLVGPILVCRKGALGSDGRQRQVDREFFLMFSVTDENQSWYSDYNFGHLHVDRTATDFLESNQMHSINGYMYGNLPGLSMCVDDRVAWHIFSVGSEEDVHTVYFHGQPLTLLDTHRSSSYILPGYYRTLLMKAENPGEWAVACQTSEHYNAGEKALFNVSDCGIRRDFNIHHTSGTNRRYFLQAEEEYWDFAPTGMDWITGNNLSDPNQDAYTFTSKEGPYLGTVYKKVRYHEYTNASFTTEIPRKDSDRYMGVLGPVLMAEAFDNITVVFRNNATRPYSVHAQGLFYKKTSEGMTYGASAGAVQPGETVTYHWSVPLDFAPAEGDPDCINQAYYSAVDPVKDTNSGLIGPLVICKPGTLDRMTGKRKDVDQFFVLLFKIFDEVESWYLQDNIQQFGTSDSEKDPDFGESNLMHSINGYVYGNNPLIEVPQYSIVDWHLMTLGNQVDLHSAHWHGNQFIVHKAGQHTRDVIQLFPGIFETVWMNMTRVGKWLLHCHVHDHLTAGMETVYLVSPPPPPTTITLDPFGGALDTN